MTQSPLDTSTKALRKFAATMAAALVILFCALLPIAFSRAVPMWPVIIATLLLLQALIYPPSLVPVQHLWMRFGGIMGWINTRVILGVLFYVILTPLGWLQRKRGELNYKIGFDNNLNTYKTPRNQRLTAKDLENPF